MPETAIAEANSPVTTHDLVVHNKFDGSVLATLPPQCSEADVQVELIRAASATPAAAAMPRHERGRILDTAADLLQERSQKVSELIVAEAGKTIKQARKEVARAVNTLKLSAAETRRNVGEVVPFDSFAGSENRQGWFTREPLGLIAAITPLQRRFELGGPQARPPRDCRRQYRDPEAVAADSVDSHPPGGPAA